jgi:hypothetical protein
MRLYAEKQQHIDSLTLTILFTMWYQLYIYDKVNHLAKIISYFTFSSIGRTNQSQLPTAISHLDITNPYHPKTH